jgi:hypothetical protein
MRKKALDRLQQRSGRTNATKIVLDGFATSEWNRKIILSGEVRRRIGKG